MVDYIDIVDEFNSRVAGLPELRARNELFNLTEEFKSDHKTAAVKKLFANLAYVRNEHAELIAGGEDRFVPYLEIVKSITPKGISLEKQREYKFLRLQKIFQSPNLSDKQKHLLYVRGVPYKKTGEVDLQEFAVDNISFEVPCFTVFEGKLDRRGDKKGAKKELNQYSIPKPEETDFHHQVISKSINRLILIDKEAHNIPHLGFVKFARIELKESNKNAIYSTGA